MKKLTLLLKPILSLIPNTALASSSGSFTNTTFGIFAVAIFVIAYILVILEEKIKLRKSVPVITAAGIIWFIIASLLSQAGDYTTANEAFKHAIVEFAELLLFLLVAMTFINSMQVFDVFESIRAKIIRMGLSLRGFFWITGLIAFFLSPVADDNLTTALVMGTIVLTVAKNNKKFISIACLNIVISANAGGAFSPFGDMTIFKQTINKLLLFLQPCSTHHKT